MNTTETAVLRETVLPGNLARSIGSMAVLLAAAKDPTPSLHLLKLSVTKYKITATATDRYVLGRLVLEHQGNDSEVSDYYLNAAALKLMATTKAGLVSIKHGETSFTVSDYNTSVSVPIFLGTFPPVENLIPEIPAAVPTGETSFSMALLTKLSKLVDANGKKIDAWKFLPGGNSEYGKPNAWAATADNYTVLIQPRLNK
jgi:hypothetical protein